MDYSYDFNASEEETEQGIRKVRERKRGSLFENMEKMDIQEERMQKRR